MAKRDQVENLTPLLVDPDFSFIALSAANELDQHSMGEESTFEATHKLGEILKKSIRSAEIAGQPAPLNLITPTMAGVYHQAFHAIPTQEDAGLPERTEGIAKALQTAAPSMHHDESMNLREFCIALAQNALGTVDLHAQY